MEHPELIGAYITGIESLRIATAGLDHSQFAARPIEGTWSSQELICHLADSEALFAERIKRVIAEDRPTLIFADPGKYVAALAYDRRDPLEEVALISSIRRQIGRILQAQPDTAWQRVGIHSTEGERTLEQLVRKAIDHFEHHLKFLQAKRDAMD